MGTRILLVICILHSLSLAADIEKSIFDDDWQSSPPTQVKPPTPVPPVTPTPDNPTPTPVVPTPPVTPQSVRVAVPTTAAQAEAWKLIKEELYKDDIANAKTVAQKVALAKKLLSVAGDTKKDTVGKYVLLAQAKEIAISSGDPPTAFKCLNAMGRSFDINYPSMKVDLFTSLSTTVSGTAECRTVAAGLNRWADGQVKADRYDVAKSAVGLASRVARKSGDAALIKQTDLHQKQIEEIETAYTAIKPALATLADKPTDPAANLAVGRFYCFMKGDWDRGLPMLALGSDTGLKTLATLETAGVSGADAQMAVGDGWWGLSEKSTGLAQNQIRSHAVKWYRQALPGLEGLAKAKVEKRVGSVQAATAGTQEEKWLSKDATYTVSSMHIRPNGQVISPLPSLLTGEESYRDNTAFHTIVGEKGSHIKIDLSHVATISRIEISNRQIPKDHPKYMELLRLAIGMRVWLSNDPMTRGKEIWSCKSADAEWSVPVASVKARYITIGFPEGVAGTLTLKYVKVFGYEGDEKVKDAGAVSTPGRPQTIDLLPLVDISGKTAWKRAGNGQLVFDGTVGQKDYGRVSIQYAPPAEFDFVIEFTQSEKMGYVHQVVTANGKELNWVVCRATRGGATGFQTPKFNLGEPDNPGVKIDLTVSKRHRSELRVRKDSVAGYVDGKLVMELKEFSKMPDASTAILALQTDGGRPTIFHTVQLKEVTGSGKRLDGAGEKEGTGDRQMEKSDAQKSDAQLLIGTWNINSQKWIGQFIFNADGTATAFSDGKVFTKGTWEMEQDVVRIKWHSHTDTFRRPLDPKGTVGTSYNQPYEAIKVESKK